MIEQGNEAATADEIVLKAMADVLADVNIISMLSGALDEPVNPLEWQQWDAQREYNMRL